MGRATLLAFAIALAIPRVAWAAAGDPDPAFGSSGYAFSNFASEATALALQPDGKLVAAGGSALARFNSDGTPDTSFGGSGVVTTPMGVGALALQSDGKIVAAGGAVVAGNSDIALARYNTDGTLDTTFDGEYRLDGGAGAC